VRIVECIVQHLEAAMFLNDRFGERLLTAAGVRREKAALSSG
jgi:hypothetical protein